MTILQLAKGNPGALSCLLGMRNLNPFQGLVILDVVENLNIVGSDLYVLWSDLCNKDYNLMAHLCIEVPGHILKDASSRQDYSGIELLKQYILEFNKQ